MPAVGYRRESSTGEDVDQAYAYQHVRLEEYGCQWIFGDRVSGRKNDREGYLRALEKIKDGSADELVVTHLFRLGRSVIECYRTINLLKEKKAKLTILGGQVNTETPEGRAFLGFQMILGQLEAEYGIERQKISWEYSAKQGRPRAMIYGYQIVEGNYVLHPGQTKKALEVIEKFLELKSLNSLTKWVNHRYQKVARDKRHELPPLTIAGLRRWMLNPILQGHLFLKEKKYYNRHTALLDADTSEEIKQIISFNNQHHGYVKPENKKIHPFSGFVKCQCGSSCIVKTHKRINKNKPESLYVYYRCWNAICKTKVNVIYIEQEFIKELLSAKNTIADSMSKADSPGLNPQLLELENKIKYLQPLAYNPNIAEAILDLQKEISEITIAPVIVFNSQKRKEYLEVLTEENLMLMTPEQKKSVVHLFIKKIEVFDRSVISVELI